MAHHLIFEGSELSGKSFTINGVWDALEKKYNSGVGVMDGCTWFNADVGLYGTRDGWELVNHYLNIAKTLNHRNLIFEKLHLTNFIYTKQKDTAKFKSIEKELKKLGFKVILTTYKNDAKLLKKRLNERLQSTPSYKRIARTPQDYLKSQKEYLKLIEQSSLPYFTVDNSKLPNYHYQRILAWLGE
ncbi:MAG: hypothetical protein COT81_02295 [Candidatus Buchananbacteria bacterium CG10_big_fil_rev_8_21_14_0_10_42_9]|uniref:Uncharacterized protein n=1 Tax=Candidatus Buchananbacteria bacterium CG10_big_fil_rev_8_21_14_0_10_42_9 TaxID=1974526 RepID=A0A2H0W1I1_9BACT|nr:MAG: hypothetical protein COT81_02295 [Candidatus Buchananbacteria bacterium CG10_big_fil_rev_8_21_14_0_10_42_9]